MLQNLVDVFELARTGRSLAGAVPINAMPRLLPLLANVDGDVDYEFRGFIDQRQRPAGSLCLKATLNLVCNHCDKPVSFLLDAHRDYYFVRDERALHAVVDDTADEDPLVGDKRFDLRALLEEEIILGLPIAPRHAACQQEVDAAAGPRAQTATAVNRPFAALDRLRTRDG